MRRIYPVQKINLAKLEGWKPYDVTGPLSNDIADSAHSTLEAATPTDLAYYAELFLEKGRKKRVYLNEGQRLALYEAFRSNDARIETFRTLMRDAVFWAWEEAYVPSEADLTAALKTAVSDVPLGLGGWILGDTLGEIMDAMGYPDQARFIAGLLETSDISIEQKDGEYFLIYDPGSSALVKRIAQHPSHVDEGGVLDWSPLSTKMDPVVGQELGNVFNDIKATLIPRLFMNLERQRQNTDFTHRARVMSMVTGIIKTHPDVVAAVKELREFFQGSASLGANPFMTTPRNRRLAKDFEEMKALAEVSPILEFEPQGDPPERYLLRLHGLGLDPDGTTRDLHEVSVQLGADYPRSMPRVQWLTPILHPNIASGTACFGNFSMNPRVRLVDVVEIIWDMTRMAIYNYHGNDSVWAKVRKDFGFPVDPRTIRGEVPRQQDPGGDVDIIIMGR